MFLIPFHLMDQMKTTESNSSHLIFTNSHPGVVNRGQESLFSSNHLVAPNRHPKLSYIPNRIVNGIIIVEPMEEDGSEIHESPSTNASTNEGNHGPISDCTRTNKGSKRKSPQPTQIGIKTVKPAKKFKVLDLEDIQRNSAGKSAIFPSRKNKEELEIIEVDSLPDEPMTFDTSQQHCSCSGCNTINRPISVPVERIYTLIIRQCKICSKRFHDKLEAIKHSDVVHRRVFTESLFIKEKHKYSKDLECKNKHISSQEVLKDENSEKRENKSKIIIKTLLPKEFKSELFKE